MQELYSRNRILSRLIFFVTLSVLLITFQLRILDQVVLFFFSPVEKVIVSLVDSMKMSVLRYYILLNVRDEYETMREENLSLRQRLHKYGEVIEEMKTLQALLDLKQNLIYQTIPARVIGKSPISPNSTLIIDRGEEHGVRKFQGVITEEGIVGRIIGVSRSSAKLQMLIDKTCAIAAMNQRTRDNGIVKGLGFRNVSLDMEYVYSRAEFQLGDVIVSSGLDGVFPPGLMIGHIVELDGQSSELFYRRIAIRPAAECNRIEAVLIVIPDKSESPETTVLDEITKNELPPDKGSGEETERDDQ